MRQVFSLRGDIIWRTADCAPIYSMQTGFAACVMIRTKGINLALTDRGTIWICIYIYMFCRYCRKERLTICSNVDSNFEWSHACWLITILYYLHAIARRDTSKNCLSGCPTHLNMFIIFDLPTFWLDDPWFVLFVKTSGSRACQAKGSRDGCREEGWECPKASCVSV